MGIWNFYFIIKLFLYFGKYMGFHVWLNLAFAIFLSVPIPERYARLKPIRQIIAVPSGIALFYYDTWLPPITRLFTQASLLESFSLTYMMELIGRFINPMVVGGLLLLYVIYFFAKKKLRISSFVYLAMLFPLFFVSQSPTQKLSASTKDEAPASNDPMSGPATEANLTTQLNSFYREESTRNVTFTPPSPADAPFDIIIVQVCSLSWDDIDFTKERDNPLFNRFDIVFTNFNSAASYSGPAAIRLLRGSCGQTKHKQLYDPAQPQCLTFDDLQNVGYEPELAMNHDGHFGDFISDVRDRGGLKAKLFNAKGMPPYLQSFDGTPVHDDYSVLSKWWSERMRSQINRVALFYNTISLHDGNYYSGHRSNSIEIYHPRLKRLLSDMDKFFNELQASGRRAVVVFVAEHGAAIRGDKMQIAGLREIPTPRITNVPLGIKLIGRSGNPPAKPVIVSEPTSYLALSQLLSNFITITPFSENSLSLKDYVQDLPSTNFVSENEDVVVMRRNKKYYIHSKGESWVEYDDSE